jgi:hypothetical protein
MFKDIDRIGNKVRAGMSDKNCLLEMSKLDKKGHIQSKL